jgi:hypothetical protein
MDLTPEEIQHGVRKFMGDEEKPFLPIFLGDDRNNVIGKVEYSPCGGVDFHLNKEFMDSLPPNVKGFELTAHYTSMFEGPDGISLTIEY